MHLKQTNHLIDGNGCLTAHFESVFVPVHIVFGKLSILVVPRSFASRRWCRAAKTDGGVSGDHRWRGRRATRSLSHHHSKPKQPTTTEKKEKRSHQNLGVVVSFVGPSTYRAGHTCVLLLIPSFVSLLCNKENILCRFLDCSRFQTRPLCFAVDCPWPNERRRHQASRR